MIESLNPRRFLENEWHSIRKVVAQVAKRFHFCREEREDLASEVCIKLLRNQGAALAAWRGQGKLDNYLRSIASRAALDEIIQRRGKWRPSKRASRAGTPIVLLERLIYRDGFSLQEARRFLAAAYGESLSSREASRWLAVLPCRPARRFVGADALSEEVSRGRDPYTTFVTQERSNLARSVERELRQLIRKLPRDDRTLLRLRYREGWTIPRIAHRLGCKSKPLYRRIAALCGQLRRELEERDFRQADVSQVIGAAGFGMNLSFRGGP